MAQPLLGVRGMHRIAIALFVLAGCQPPAEPVSSHAPIRCGTSPRHLAAMPRARAALKADGPRQLRDGYGTFESPILSERFALKWGPDATVDPAVGERILQGLERAYAVEVEMQGHPAPAGIDAYYLNVYVGNSGGGAPEIPFEGAYVTIDPEGHPIMTLHPKLLGLSPHYADAVTAHELFHTVQLATEKYATDNGYWFWEATAEWAATEVYPDHPEDLVGAYALLPHVSLTYVDYPDENTLIEGHHYGAAIFPRYVTEKAADWTAIRDAWTAPADPLDPMRSLDAILRARGGGVDEAYARFAATNATWDYERGRAYEQMAGTFASYYPDEDARVAADLGSDGAQGWVEAKAATRPWRYGYNIVRAKAPSAGAWRIGFEGDAAGSYGSASHFRVTLVRERTGGRREYVPLALDQAGKAEITVEDVGEERALHLVVAADPQTADLEETFGYRYLMEPIVPEPEPEPISPEPTMPSSSGGCAVAGRAPASGVALLLGLAGAAGLCARRRISRAGRRRGCPAA